MRILSQSHRNIVNKLSVLEYVIGYRNITPHQKNGYGTNFNRLVSSILYYLGLYDYYADVVFVNDIKSGGYIYLSDSRKFTIYVSDVFMLSSMYGSNVDAVYAVISHEICHKLLYGRHFRVVDEKENEIYTDLAVIYTGLGKLILDGCASLEMQMDGARVKAQSQVVGYMPKRDYAYAYALTNSLYGCPKSLYMKELSFHSKLAVWRWGTPHINRNRFLHRISSRTKEYQHCLHLAKEMENVIVLRGSIKKIEVKIEKLKRANDVMDNTDFTKPITAYALYREPKPVWTLLRIKFFYICYKLLFKKAH